MPSIKTLVSDARQKTSPLALCCFISRSLNMTARERTRDYYGTLLEDDYMALLLGSAEVQTSNSVATKVSRTVRRSLSDISTYKYN